MNAEGYTHLRGTGQFELSGSPEGPRPGLVGVFRFSGTGPPFGLASTLFPRPDGGSTAQPLHEFLHSAVTATWMPPRGQRRSLDPASEPPRAPPLHRRAIRHPHPPYGRADHLADTSGPSRPAVRAVRAAVVWRPRAGRPVRSDDFSGAGPFLRLPPDHRTDNDDPYQADVPHDATARNHRRTRSPGTSAPKAPRLRVQDPAKPPR